MTLQVNRANYRHYTIGNTYGIVDNEKEGSNKTAYFNAWEDRQVN
jgi:hypothetical protein